MMTCCENSVKDTVLFAHHVFCSVHLWVALSAMYGKVLVLLMLAFCLIEVMDNNIKPMAFQVGKVTLFMNVDPPCEGDQKKFNSF